MDFSRLEMRELLAHVNQTTIDPEVLAKLQYGATALPGATPAQLVVPNRPAIYTPEQVAILKTVAIPARPTDHIVNQPLGRVVLTPAMEARGMTQADVDAINAQAAAQLEAEQHIRANYRPIVGEANKANPNAAYAPPDVPLAPPPEQTDLGRVNRYGDKCVSYQGNEPVFECKAGHGYTYNRAVPGCPRCFMTGSANAEDREAGGDPNAVAGMEPF